MTAKGFVGLHCQHGTHMLISSFRILRVYHKTTIVSSATNLGGVQVRLLGFGVNSPSDYYGE
jgi:hypothetical protein